MFAGGTVILNKVFFVSGGSSDGFNLEFSLVFADHVRKQCDTRVTLGVT